ncbi:aminotransferase class V-fold PLP-dependent enzyme [Yinghuangia seranimata]|uniref:aminotransferase class V-fold PLP-dependent enzyme n=1 Tax=Yinghuangia seranimata TaxID=408067 RepID=UPI00248C9CE5|nr:aminotransferase class V-fold PLP-dependent enzyme [Yinghuangia seranimata]MDI2129846.1 aminotransferase class V-fold PLP-dependent enzyme [Yinghuangia seranimata]
MLTNSAVARLRADTPGCANVTHLNNAGASLQPRAVTDAVIAHLRLEAETGGYEAAAARAPEIEHTYDAIARLIGARPDEIAVVENATRAWDMAFYGLRWQPGDRILTARAEYASNAIAFLQTARRYGVQIDVVPDDETGRLSLDAMRGMLDERVKLIAITHVPTQGGLVNPAAEVGRIAREAGVTYLLDACQSVGQLPVDVDEIGCDLLSAPGRKFLRGPRGTGFLYASRRVLGLIEPPFLDLHAATWTSPDTYEIRDDARRFETWEGNYAGRIGLGVAVDYALEVGVDTIKARNDLLATRLRAALAERPGVTLRDLGSEQCAIVTFTVAGHDSRTVAKTLVDQGINVSVSIGDYAQWDLSPRGLDAVVRASVHYYNTEEEVDRLAEAIPAPTRA